MANVPYKAWICLHWDQIVRTYIFQLNDFVFRSKKKIELEIDKYVYQTG